MKTCEQSSKHARSGQAVLDLLAANPPFDQLTVTEWFEQVGALSDEQIIWVVEDEDAPDAATAAATAELLRRIDRVEMKKLTCAEPRLAASR
jgi:hypothetical protein